ncbi:urease accessory protein UreD [Inhella proteolytica]|uniref:urease accessory protein UreD n=1 Tax=Inhella proteolytica TaxID=2795029 RepID=UPI001E5A169A|nr:urease accessory protein UreD [Inhella proteolytica]
MLREPGIRWPARLALQARREGAGTLLHAEHHGPLRLLKTLYPEGPATAHAVLVHPPGGLVGGDRLDMEVAVEPGAHLLVTTPAATRFYRSATLEAAQQLSARVAPGGRLEWLPQETLAYRGCKARNQVTVQLQGQLLASELLVLGLAAAGQPFTEGELLQELHIEGLWRDRGWIRAQDRALLEGPCGLAGLPVLGTMVLAQGQAWTSAEAEALLERTRALLEAQPLRAGVTLLHGRLLLLRVLAAELEPAAALMRRVRALWRERAWGLAPCEPRIWRS